MELPPVRPYSSESLIRGRLWNVVPVYERGIGKELNNSKLTREGIDPFGTILGDNVVVTVVATGVEEKVEK